MDFSSITHILSLWILAIPLAIVVLRCLELPLKAERALSDRRSQRQNIIGARAIRSGDTAISRG